MWQPGRDRKSKRLDYHRKSFHNPYFSRNQEQGRRGRGFVWPSWPKKTIFLSLLLLISAYGLFWFMAKSRFFSIKSIEIAVPAKFDQESVRSLAWGQASQTKFGLSQSNLLVFDADNLSKLIDSQYAASAITIKKIYPDNLKISFEEKVYEAVWLEAGHYYLLNKDDQAAVAIEPSSLEDKLFPLIENRGRELFFEGKIASSGPKVRFIVDIFSNISKNISNKPEKFIINDLENGPIELKIANGPRLIFSEREDLDKQLKKLYTVINERLKTDFMKKEYIDVRFGDSVYIK
jgi:cell division septal protein FtsQ